MSIIRGVPVGRLLNALVERSLLNIRCIFGVVCVCVCVCLSMDLDY